MLVKEEFRETDSSIDVSVKNMGLRCRLKCNILVQYTIKDSQLETSPGSLWCMEVDTKLNHSFSSRLLEFCTWAKSLFMPLVCEKEINSNLAKYMHLYAIGN